MPDKKLNINQKTVMQLFDDKESFFLIPDYQRPYAWTDDECSTLWEDLCIFACPDEDYTAFNPAEEYFLGSIVIFKNNEGKFEVIDGQQRLITILLMLRAFYKVIDENFKTFCSDRSITPEMIDMLDTVRKNIAKVIWQTNEFGKPDKSRIKIDSLVATDDDREEMLVILRDGALPKPKRGRYAKNYRFYLDSIKELQEDKNKFRWLIYLPIRIMNSCILFPIEAGNQKSALRIFSTLNDRGKPLSDSDIFKVQLYKAFSEEGKRDYFLKQWRELELLCEKIFNPKSGTPLDELFRRYMYYAATKEVIHNTNKHHLDTTMKSIRSFYERQDYRILRAEHEHTFAELQILADFWNNVFIQNDKIFSERVLKRLFVLCYAPNALWTYITSVYFMHNRKSDGTLEENNFCSFLNKITAFIWGQSIIAVRNSNALRSPLFTEMTNILQNKPVTFSGYTFDIDDLRYKIDNFNFSGAKRITRSMLAWRAFQFEEQELIPITTALDAEHICSYAGIDKEIYESIGNKSFLEKKIKDIAKVFNFRDKKKYYTGLIHLKKQGTQIYELLKIAREHITFSKSDIEKRQKNITEDFVNFVKANGLTFKRI